MCGISGFNWKDEEKIRGMVYSLSYRGPDADGVYTNEGVSLGHNRLSIIDLSSEANQPMFDSTRELIIVFNGEIYNFLDLKNELKSEYEFRTQSDTEVILAGYRKWGKEVVKKLNGMFAFAIWDTRDKTLFVARDHMGMKPLYYYWDQQKFIFASEMSAVLTHNIPRKLDKEAFNHYLRVLYTPEPLTMIQNVFKLPPAHSLTLKSGQIHIESYGEVSQETFKGTYIEAVSEVRNKVKESVERHLVADVPVGVYLSGGIDSSTVLAAMSQMRKNIKTFTIGFELQDKSQEGKFNQDFDLAKKTSAHFGSEHHSLIVSSKDVVESLQEVTAHNSDPVSNPTSVAMFLLSRFARKEVTVALTGNAGDELFGGYDRYRTALWARYLYSPTNLLAKFMFQKDDTLSEVISSDVLLPGKMLKKTYKKYLVGGDMAEKLMNADQRSWLPDHFFMLSDHMSMANALEERVPLADKNLVEFARSLPRQYKVDLSNTKKVLKDAFRGELPDFLFNEPKRGWFSPAAKWFREPEFQKFTRGILNDDYYPASKTLFNWIEVGSMLEKHIDKTQYNLTTLWAILTFQMWAKKYNIEI